MKPLVYMLFFGLVLVTSSAISFVGYRYLGMANDYREANFEHLDAVYTAIDEIRQQPVPTADGLTRLRDLVIFTSEKATWCLDNLNAVDRLLFRSLGAQGAIDVCHEAIASAQTTVDILNELEESRSGSARSMPMSYVLYNQITREIEHLRFLSQSFQPYVSQIQQQLEVVVRTGTAVVSVVLLLLSVLVARQLVRAQENIRTQSITDALTGLLNRRGFDMEIATVPPGAEVILARIDLDRFKQVNDILGHDAGDFVLAHVADMMRKHASSSDTLARVGGDEFVILFALGTDKARASAVIEALFSDINQPLRYADKQCVYGASFGLASTEVDGLAVDDLLNAADKALYEVKRGGRGSVSVYSHAMHAAAVRERALADRFRDALKHREIVPYFHSQHFAEDWSLFGVEVLARWEHPEEGLLTPDQFLGIAAQLGMEADLDRVIFDQTVELLEHFTRDGFDIPRLAFNVSAGRITDPSFISDIRDRIPTHRERFAFEILESVSYEESSELLSFTVDSIKELGFQVDVDDFGSGHASINSVLNIAPDALKIDRNIVRPIAESAQALRMTASIVELANALDMEVIAEGVDTVEKAQLLHAMGCHALQGFFFSQPMPSAELRSFLQNPTVISGPHRPSKRAS
jgi:diguanylate cyclase (GGDEF)-like protein